MANWVALIGFGAQDLYLTNNVNTPTFFDNVNWNIPQWIYKEPPRPILKNKVLNNKKFIETFRTIRCKEKLKLWNIDFF